MIKALTPNLDSADIFARYCRDVLPLAGSGPVVAPFVKRPFSPVCRDGLFYEIRYHALLRQFLPMLLSALRGGMF